LITAQNKDLTFKQVTKLVGQKWRALNLEEQQEWDHKAAPDRYHDEMKTFKAN